MKFVFKSIFLGLCAILLLWGGGFLVFAASLHALTPTHPDVKTDAIIVLTGGNHRVKTGFKLWQQGMAPTLFVTGVNKGVTYADLLHEWPNDQEGALPECCLTLGYEATTTRGNAKEAQEWVMENNITSIRLVTSNYHMKRAMLEFSQTIPSAVNIYEHVVDVADHTPESRILWYLAFLEYNKVLWRRAELILGVDFSR